MHATHHKSELIAIFIVLFELIKGERWVCRTVQRFQFFVQFQNIFTSSFFATIITNCLYVQKSISFTVELHYFFTPQISGSRFTKLLTIIFCLKKVVKKSFETLVFTKFLSKILSTILRK